MHRPSDPALTLYYSPGACSLAAHIALHESGLAFEARPALIANGEHLQAEYLAINPRGTLAAAQCAEWLAWFTSGVHISFALVWRGSRFVERTELHAELKAMGLATLRRQFADIETRLAAHDYLVDRAYSIADPNALVFYRWAGRIGMDVRRDYPAWTRMPNG
ncbi:MAG: glutathione S-transferase family protein [Gammaproteobacteria bacterium]